VLLIGWFLNSGAQSYITQHELTSILSGITLGNVMNSRIISVRKDTYVDHLIHDYFNKDAKDSFPVVDDYGRLVGLVTFKDAWNIQEQKRNSVQVANIMIEKSSLIIMQTDRTADDALKYMSRRHMSRVFICDQEGKLIGLVSKTDILNAATERKEYVEAVKKFNVG
jgi:predicted transcriptional regulator